MNRRIAIGALLLAIEASARADSITSSFNWGTAVTAHGFGAGAFDVVDNTTNTSFKAFCVDLYDNVPGSAVTFNAKVTYGVGDNGPTFPGTGTPGIGNKIGY